MSNRQHFRITAGEDRTLSLTALNSSGTPINLTSYTISWSMALKRGGNPVVTKTGTVVSASAGTFTVSLSDADTGLLKNGTYFYQALCTSGATTLNGVEGNIFVEGQNSAFLESSAGAVFNNNQLYGTRAEAIGTKIGPSPSWIETGGYSTVGDGLGGKYKRTGTPTSQTDYFQSADGAYWQLFESDGDDDDDSVTIPTTSLMAWFDPSDLTTLFVDTAATINAANDGDRIAVMQDKSDSEAHARQGTLAKRPTLRIRGDVYWLEFDGVSQYMTMDTLALATSVATVCIGVKVDTAPASDSVILETKNAVTGNNAFAFLATATTPAVYSILARSNGNAQKKTTTADRIIGVYTALFDYTSSGTGFNTLRCNALSDQVTGTNTLTTTATTFDTGTFTLGARATPTLYTAMKFYGLTIYNSTLDSTDYGTVETYMRGKIWPSTRPYGTYNFDASQLSHYAYAKKKWKANGNAPRILCVGDSTTEGYEATAFDVGAHATAYPTILAQLLNAKDFRWNWAAGMTAAQFATNDTRYSFDTPTTAWAMASAGFESIGGLPFTTTTVNKALHFAPGITFDTINVYYLRTLSTGTGQISINGGASLGTFDTVAFATDIKKKTVTCTRGTQTVDIQLTTGTAIYVLGIEVEDSIPPKVQQVINAGWNASLTAYWNVTTNQFSPNSYNVLNLLDQADQTFEYAINRANADLMIMALGRAAVVVESAATIKTNILAMIDNYKLVGDIMLSCIHPLGTSGGATDAIQAAQRRVFYEMADSRNLVLHDPTIAWNTTKANADALGYTDSGDTVHPKAAGYANFALLISQILNAVPAAVEPLSPAWGTAAFADVGISGNKVPVLSQINTFIGGQVIEETGAGTGTLTVRSLDAGSANAPLVDYNRNSASPANGDGLGVFRFLGNTSGGGAQTGMAYASFLAYIKTADNATSQGQLVIRTTKAAAEVEQLKIEDGIYTPNASGGAKGVDTINTGSLYTDLLVTRTATVAAANGRNDNLAIGATASYCRITGPTGAYQIGGIASGIDGRRLTIYSTVSQTLTINNEDANSTAANRITVPAGANAASATATKPWAVTLIYDGTASRWIFSGSSG